MGRDDKEVMVHGGRNGCPVGNWWPAPKWQRSAAGGVEQGKVDKQRQGKKSRSAGCVCELQNEKERERPPWWRHQCGGGDVVEAGRRRPDWRRARESEGREEETREAEGHP